MHLTPMCVNLNLVSAGGCEVCHKDLLRSFKWLMQGKPLMRFSISRGGDHWQVLDHHTVLECMRTLNVQTPIVYTTRGNSLYKTAWGPGSGGDH